MALSKRYPHNHISRVPSIFCSMKFLICALIVLNATQSFCASSYLDITSTPSGVDIYINDELVGRTPLTGVEVQSGQIKIRAIKEGYGTATQHITLKPDELQKVNIKLNPSKEQTGETQSTVTISQDKGDLIVINKLGDMPVSIDNVVKGNGSIKLTGMATGAHEIRVGSFIKTIQIYKDYTIKVVVEKTGIVIMNDLEEIARAEAKAKKEIARAEAKAKKEMEERLLKEREEEERENAPTLLMSAIKAGNTISVERLLEKYPLIVNEVVDESTPLFNAVSFNQSFDINPKKSGNVRNKLVEILVKYGADPNQGSFLGSAFNRAATFGDIDVMKVLLLHNADINAVSGTLTAVTPLIGLIHGYRTARGNECDYWVEALRYLLDNGSDVNIRVGKKRITALESLRDKGINRHLSIKNCWDVNFKKMEGMLLEFGAKE